LRLESEKLVSKFAFIFVNLYRYASEPDVESFPALGQADAAEDFKLKRMAEPMAEADAAEEFKLKRMAERMAERKQVREVEASRRETAAAAARATSWLGGAVEFSVSNRCLRQE
jgi:hypothetical protein